MLSFLPYVFYAPLHPHPHAHHAPSPHPAAFIFRGKGYANGNGWNRLPVQQDETSMRFADQETWNAVCAQKNAAYAAFLG